MQFEKYSPQKWHRRERNQRDGRPDETRESIVLIFILVLLVATYLTSKAWLIQYGMHENWWEIDFWGVVAFKAKVYGKGIGLILLTVLLAQVIGIDVLGLLSDTTGSEKEDEKTTVVEGD